MTLGKREEVWLRAWVAVANTLAGKEPDCLRYADACLRSFDERFPTLKHETQYCGTPLSELGADERSKAMAHINGIPGKDHAW